MTASITQLNGGVSAFTKRNDLVMAGGKPVIQWSLKITEIEKWLTTLEALMEADPLSPHYFDLLNLRCTLQTAYEWHLREHQEVVADAPSADDLAAYLSDYAAAIKQGGI